MKPFSLSTRTPAFLCMALVLSLGVWADADYYLETFDGPLNSAIWTLNSGGNDWNISNGKLTITRTNGNSGQLLFAPQLIGDFDVQFDYALSWPSTYGFGDRLQLGVFSDAPQYGYAVGQTQEGNSFGVAVDPSPRYGFGSNQPTGKLRVTRAGSDVLMQHWSSGDWVTLQTGTDSRDMWVSLDNYIHNGFTSGSQVEIDNFSISADRFSTAIPEPGCSALFLVGLGMFGIRLRKVVARPALHRGRLGGGEEVD